MVLLSRGDLYLISLASSSSLPYPHPCSFLFPAHQHLQPLLLPFPSFLLPSSNPLHCVFSSRNVCKHHFPTNELCLAPLSRASRRSRPASLLGDDPARNLPPPNFATPSQILSHSSDKQARHTTFLRSTLGPPFESHSCFSFACLLA